MAAALGFSSFTVSFASGRVVAAGGGVMILPGI